MANGDTDRIALIDMDGTVADYDGEMRRRTRPMMAPGEEECASGWEDVPPHVEARRRAVKRVPGFWRGLPRLDLGFIVVGLLRELGFELHVLTKGPASVPTAWSEKLEWCGEHLPDVNVTVTQDKSLVYGRVLVDDYPPYYQAWLRNRPRGLVVAPAQPWNEGVIYAHPQVVRFDGSNVGELRERLTAAYGRQAGPTG